jgi:hypothetical protein
MAHFTVPPQTPKDGYDIDNKHAPGSVWRIQIPRGGAKKIGLWGGSGLFVRSNNPKVVVYDSRLDDSAGEVRLLNLVGANEGTSLIEVGSGNRVWIVLQIQVVVPPSALKSYIIRDTRLHGYRPTGDVLEVDSGTPVGYMMDMILNRSKKCGGNLKVIFMAHGLPGFIQCGMGAHKHPATTGISIADLGQFAKIRGAIKQISIYSCLVARTGSCAECGNLEAYDGNLFCYQLAQTTQARVKASLHLQFYQDGTTKKWTFRRPDGGGLRFGIWNGTVFTWGPEGNIISREDFPYIPPTFDTSRED